MKRYLRFPILFIELFFSFWLHPYDEDIGRFNLREAAGLSLDITKIILDFPYE